MDYIIIHILVLLEIKRVHVYVTYSKYNRIISNRNNLNLIKIKCIYIYILYSSAMPVASRIRIIYI